MIPIAGRFDYAPTSARSTKATKNNKNTLLIHRCIDGTVPHHGHHHGFHEFSINCFSSMQHVHGTDIRNLGQCLDRTVTFICLDASCPCFVDCGCLSAAHPRCDSMAAVQTPRPASDCARYSVTRDQCPTASDSASDSASDNSIARGQCPDFAIMYSTVPLSDFAMLH